MTALLQTSSPQDDEINRDFGNTYYGVTSFYGGQSPAPGLDVYMRARDDLASALICGGRSIDGFAVWFKPFVR